MAAELTPLEQIRIRLAIEDLNTAFAYHLDRDDVDALMELFTDDVTYTHGERRSEGRQALEQVFRRRTSSGPRTSRHVYSGLRLTIETVDRVRGTSVCVTFAKDGVPPLEPAIPTLVADFDDLYLRGSDGCWRIKERHIQRIFVDPANTGPVGRPSR